MLAATALAAGLYLGRHHLGALGAHNRSVAADFSLADVQGGKLSLSAYRGQVVLLDFWATWCDPCREEIPRLVEWQSKYGAQGLQIIGISMDDGVEPVRNFYREFKLNYPVAMGNEQLTKAYGGIFGVPVNIVIGRDGRIHSTHTGQGNLDLMEREIRRLLAESPQPAPTQPGH